MKLLSIIITTLSFSVFAELPKERRLKKLSMHIRGLNPTAEEYLEATQVPQVDLEDFFIKKTDEYLSSKEHVEKMNIRLHQLFRLNLEQYSSNGFSPYRKNSLNDLFEKIARENLSWDTLLTGKSYKMYMSSNDFEVSDIGYYGGVIDTNKYPQVSYGILNASNERLFPEEIVTEDHQYDRAREFVVEHEFSSNDQRIAGALSTRRFFSRNVNTAINKNRKRAASVFRIFLCDDMEAAITDSSDRTDYILDFVFPETTGMSNSDIANLSLTDSAHGQRPDCMACHYKLDPMGKNFGGSGIALAPMAFSGALSYKTSDGQKVNIPTGGLGDLGNILSQQKDYKRCQTEHFWNWFIGEDKHLTEEIHDELVNEYENLDGKTNDFINYLVNRKEFFDNSSMTEEAKLAFKVKKTLRSCNQCHQEEDMPSFTDWPIESPEAMKTWTDKISVSLGLNGEQKTMPPSSHVWQPSEEELQEIKDWINIGAPNEKGIRQLP